MRLADTIGPLLTGSSVLLNVRRVRAGMFIGRHPEAGSGAGGEAEGVVAVSEPVYRAPEGDAVKAAGLMEGV